MKKCLLRKEKSLTQSELAERINVTNSSIFRWDSGHGLPNVSLLGLNLE